MHRAGRDATMRLSPPDGRSESISRGEIHLGRVVGADMVDLIRPPSDPKPSPADRAGLAEQNTKPTLRQPEGSPTTLAHNDRETGPGAYP
jgi:hypothetical protein